MDRQALEQQRINRLIKLIHALETRLATVQPSYGSAAAIRRMRLKQRILRLQAELDQPMLLPLK